MIAIRPAYKRDRLVGFCVVVNDEPVGRVFELYKNAAKLYEELKHAHQD